MFLFKHFPEEKIATEDIYYKSIRKNTFKTTSKIQCFFLKVRGHTEGLRITVWLWNWPLRKGKHKGWVPQKQVKYVNENMQVIRDYPKVKVKGSGIFFFFFFLLEKIQLLENYTGLLRLKNPYLVFSISLRLTLSSWSRLRLKESESLTK